MIFLFTEIDHPEVLERKGDPEANHVLASQYFLIEEMLSQHGVTWMQRTPLGVLAAFEGGQAPDFPPLSENADSLSPPSQARPGDAAVALQKEFQNHLWENFGKAKLKIALHAGEAEPVGQTYVGPEVHHTLKLLEATPVGQTLLTVPAVHFIPLPPRSRLKDLGRHFLKDLSPPQNLHALLHPDTADGEVPPLRTLESYPQNFFPQTSPFFGREEEMVEITGLLSLPQTRLVTLVGPGGFGKTRLALQTAAETVEKFKDGVFFVALASLLSDHMLIASIASAVKFFFYGAEDSKTQLLAQLREKRMLLVMDNFEHIIEGAELVREILSAAPDVKILATSREKLGIVGEKIFEVKGLRYPATDVKGALEASSAVQLFLKSARRVQPQFTLAAEDRGHLLNICRSLEGMPLGLELSATWVGTLTLPQIAGKIESNRDFLATSMPHLPARHRSLRAVFEYSWILLTESQKKVLKAISVFRGGFTEAAMKKVAGAGEEVLEKLAKKSLVRKKEGRWEIHELLRYYAKEKLFDDPQEKEKCFDAHCVYYGNFLEAQTKFLYGPAQKATLEELESEADNIREGWNRAIEKSMEMQLSDFAEGLHSIFDIKGWYVEGRDAFQKATESIKEKYAAAGRMPAGSSLLLARLLSYWGDFENALGDATRARKLLLESVDHFGKASAMGWAGGAFTGLGKVNEAQGDYKAAKKYYEDALRAFRKADDRRGTILALNQLGCIASLEGDFKSAQTLVGKSLSFARRDRDQRAMAHSYILLGDAFYGLGVAGESKVYYQKGLEAYLASGDRKGVSWAFINLGRAAEMLGDYPGARQMYTEGMTIVRDMGDLRALAWADNLLGSTFWATGDYRQAQQLYEEGLFLYREAGDRRGQAWSLDLLGNVALAQGNDQESENSYRKARELVSKEGMSVQNKGWDAFHEGALLAFRGGHRAAFQKFQEGLRWFRSVGDSLGEAVCFLHLGEESLDFKEPSAAEGYFRNAASLLLERRLAPQLVDLMAGVAQLLKVQGDERQALGFLLLALSQPTCRQQTKDRTLAFLAELKSHFSAQEVEGAAHWAQSTPIEQVAAAWMASRVSKSVRRSIRRAPASPKRRKPHRVRWVKSRKARKTRRKK